MEQYLKEKEERKRIWLQRATAHDSSDEVIEEALQKFEKTYPSYKENNV